MERRKNWCSEQFAFRELGGSCGGLFLANGFGGEKFGEVGAVLAGPLGFVLLDLAA